MKMIIIIILWGTETSKKFFIFQETKICYISGGTSKAPKNKFFIFLRKKLWTNFYKNTLGY